MTGGSRTKVSADEVADSIKGDKQGGVGSQGAGVPVLSRPPTFGQGPAGSPPLSSPRGVPRPPSQPWPSGLRSLQPSCRPHPAWSWTPCAPSPSSRAAGLFQDVMGECGCWATWPPCPGGAPEGRQRAVSRGAYPQGSLLGGFRYPIQAGGGWGCGNKARLLLCVTVSLTKGRTASPAECFARQRCLRTARVGSVVATGGRCPGTPPGLPLTPRTSALTHPGPCISRPLTWPVAGLDASLEHPLLPRLEVGGCHLRPGAAGEHCGPGAGCLRHAPDPGSLCSQEVASPWSLGHAQAWPADP
ncbi:uncharacterized protein LOC119510286 [Choloepus didactylus]|uniref:uncharacterized protein LOC119510286 n=1 Tax=Choloepus didactylus TaxID=27675 RepID=UPI0018A040CD|nr:uncharacterized protein LOC119510286 [Choloepus didactylus]